MNDLKQISVLDEQIREQKAFIRRLRDTLTVAGVSFEKEAPQLHAPAKSRIEQVILQVIEEEEKLKHLKQELSELEAEVTLQIQKLDNAKHRQLLYDVYIKRLSLKRVAYDMKLSYSYIKQQHAEAVKKYHDLTTI